MFLTAEQSRFRLPIVIYNTGARTQVVESLRLVIASTGDMPLEWITVRDRLRPGSSPEPDFRSPFAVDGRRAVKLFPEFGEDPPRWKPSPGTAHQVALQARLLRSAQWKTVASFPLTIPAEGLTSYITHRSGSGLSSN